MGFNLSGYVLRPARVATGNASSTGEATSGVSRDHLSPAEMLAAGYEIPAPRDVEPYADMYRAAVLLRGGGTDEYLVWAATSGSLSTVDSDAFRISGDPTYVQPAEGSLTVGTYTDGTATFYVRDENGRDLSSVTGMTLLRGDTLGQVVAAFDPGQDPLIGKVVIDAATLSSMGGGFSVGRGDQILLVSYRLSGPTFWWSRNDSQATRFGWDGSKGRWVPFQGTTPQDLGEVGSKDSYELSPPPSRFSVGDTLPGASGSPDSFSLVRGGLFPDSTAIPLDILVVADPDTEGDYPAVGSGYDAVVGVTNGVLLLNTTYTTANVGLTLWYNPESFRPGDDGDLGELAGLPTDSTLGYPVLSPVPGPTERPFIRLGSRRYLAPVAYDTDADLPGDPSSVPEGEVWWSRATGKVVFSETDIKKTQPGETEYDIAYLGAHAFYDGVSLSTQPVPLQSPVPLVDENGNELVGEDTGGSGVPGSGDLFIQRSASMPPPGASGVLYVPDRTGESPDSSTAANARPNGSGLVRQLEGVGDTFIFAGSRALETLEVVEYEEDIPTLKIRVKKTEAVTSLEPAPSQPPGFAATSRVQMKRRGIKGEGLYFAQAQVTPATYSDEARLYSRNSEPYTLVGTEELRFAVDGTPYTWTASGSGEFTAAQIATELNTVITGTGQAGVIRGRVFIEAGTPSSGRVEIGWNTDADDLSGHTVLGFLPGWRVDASGDTFRWQPDNGSSLGLYRSPENLSRENLTADIRATGSYTGKVFTDNVQASPFVHVNNPPLVDIPGFDEDVHFQMSLGLNLVRLSNYGLRQRVGLKYDLENNRVIWAEFGETPATTVLSPTDTLQLDHTGVIEETVDSEAMDPTRAGFGLYLKRPGLISYSELGQGSEFLLPGEGAPGQAVLISPEGGSVYSGGGGTFSSGVFSNPVLSPESTQNAILQGNLLSAVSVGDRLHVINGSGAGLYTVTGANLVGGIAEFTVSPTPADETGLSWRILEGQTTDTFDPTILADAQRVPFNHFLNEPFRIRLLSPTGTVGGSLSAVVSDALGSNRPVALRFGLASSSPSATVSFLETGSDLGTLAETGLSVPDVTDPHFLNSTAPATAYFRIRVGSQEFTAGTNMTLVSSFSPTIATGEIEVGEPGGGVAGEIRFASDVLTNFAGETVYYDQLFLDGSLLASGFCEIDPTDGSIRLSDADTTAHTGETAYFLEELITERGLDVVMSPLSGDIYITKPLRDGQIVEAAYYQADTDGDPLTGTLITEFLPLIVQLEEATRVDDFTYTFNPTGRTVSEEIEAAIWVGVELQNFAGLVQVTVSGSTLTFAEAVDPSETVKITYGVLEAFGGEQAYQVSTPPVYRKPFFLEEGQDTATVEGNRTPDVQVGALMVLDQTLFYVKSVSYDAGEDETTFTVWPPPSTEVGSRAPARDSEFSFSSQRIAITVDPSDPVAGGGQEGFLPVVSGVPLVEADRGQLQVVFLGDLTQYARVGHLLEIAGYPYLVAGSALSDDGRFTRVDLSNPIATGHTSTDTIRLSVRPVFGPLPRTFPGISGFVDTEEFSLFLVGRTEAGVELPGKELTEGVHYEADPSSGAVEFVLPTQGALQPGESLVATYTAVSEVGPLVDEAAILAPAFKAQYLFITTPSLQNRILGATLTAQYTFSNPDSFFYEVLPMEDFLGEVSGKALGAVASDSGGPTDAFAGLPDNSEQGLLGLRGDVRDKKDLDRAARAFIELYNGVVLAFEQVLESFDGRVIGDRDGKFRFFIGHDKRYAGPGYEDEISGDLTVRLIWREVLDEWSGGVGFYEEVDPVYDPTTATEKDPVGRPGETDGDTPDPETLASFTVRQRGRVKNDMDDRLLIGMGRPRGLALIFPGLNVPGLFRDMWEPHVYSRLFPERARHFSRLLPGIDAVPSASGFTDPGYYTSGRKVETPGPEPGETTKSVVRTRGTAIGNISNEALGNITGIIEVLATDRHPRARIWRFFPEGDAEMDSALTSATGITVSTVGKATLVATPLLLSEFPVDPDTGWPDATQLMFNPLPAGASLFSLFTGDIDLSTPGFETGQRLRFGKPDGSVFELSDPNGNGIFVGEVQVGCILTLVGVDGSDLSGSEVLVDGTDPLEDVVSENTGRGDTIFGGEDLLDIEDIPEDEDEITPKQMRELSRMIPDYRVQFDLKVARGSGEFIDASLPGREDIFPLPLQDMLGQKPPQPLSCIEGLVEFNNTDRRPVKLPCLKGESADDSGDIQIPYLQGTETELAILGDVAAKFRILLGADTSVAMPYGDQTWKAVYPDEIVAVDGVLVETYTLGPDRDPATLYTGQDLTPVATAGSYTDGTAIGDGRAYDLILVEADQPQEAAGELLTGMTGILSVGAVSSGKVETPRFVTPTTKTDTHKYTVENAFGYLGGAFPATSGLTPSETNPGNWITLLDCSSVGGLVFDSNGGGLAGGLLALVAGGNAIVIRLYNPDPATASGQSLIGEVVIPTLAAAGSIYVNDPFATVTTLTLAGTGVSLTAAGIISVETSASLLSALSGVTGGNYHDFTVTIDTYITNTTRVSSGNNIPVGSAGGSTTCEIKANRLTFGEQVSFATTLPRNSNPANGDATELGVSLEAHESPIGAGTATAVNASAEVNGGSALTFLERVGPDEDSTVLSGVPYVGTFIPGAAGSEEGKLRAMAWEGHGNTTSPFTTGSVEGVIFSVIPSSDLDEDSVILEGDGTLWDAADGALTVDGLRHWISAVSATSGGLSEVVPGDILLIDQTTGGGGAVATGTYLVRHAVDTNTGNLWEQEIYSDAGQKNGLDLRFPSVKSAISLTLVAEEVPEVPHSPEDCGFPTGDGATTFVYLIRNSRYAIYDAGSYTLQSDSVYRMAYSAVSYDSATGEATFTLSTGTATDANGGALTDAEFRDAANESGVQVSGMIYFPFTPRASHGLPSNNVVGSSEDGSGNDATAGFTLAVMGNRNPSVHGTTTVTTMAWDKTSTASDIQYLLGDTSTPSSSSLGVRVPTPVSEAVFFEDRASVRYARSYAGVSIAEKIEGVPTHVSLEGMQAADWTAVHFDTGAGLPGQVLECLLPRDRFILGSTLEEGGTPGFTALGGVFLEPTFARPSTDLNLARPHVVSDSHSLAGFPAQVGHRNYSDFVPGTYSEAVHFKVRRIRRFHEIQTEISDALSLLKYLYEIRRGTFGSYVAATRTFSAGTSPATTIGDFNEGRVNINAGDVLRILDVNGALIDSAEIQGVSGAGDLILRRPGLTASLVSAATFEIYLEQPIVPQEQSNAQLLDCVTDSEVLRRVVDYPGGDTDGGSASTWNTMQDNLVSSWTSEGVVEGDYVLVQPAGELYDPSEKGVRPVGDTGTVGRSAYVSGAAAALDDNRGAYKITGISGGDLEVDGTSRFGGSDEGGGDDVILGGTGAEYVALPTIHVSTLGSGREGQNTLRPTAPAVGGLFGNRTGNDAVSSIQPFPYRIIRPNSIFSQDALDLVFFLWERTLSWLDEIKGIYEEGRGGDYHVFQAEDHINNIGSPTDPTDGAGVVSNLVVESLEGLVDETPYTNTSDCLSILGRRFWLLDGRLDEGGWTDFADDGFGQRPVIPDLIEDVLNLDDRFRDLRYAWIRFRADRVDGSIMEARRAEDELPDKLQRQRELVALKKGLDS